MHNNVIEKAFAVLFIVIAGTGAALAWDATFPRGPVKLPGPFTSGTAKSAGLVKFLGPSVAKRPTFLRGGSISGAGDFGSRTVAYPSDRGVELGTGWDFVLNDKKYASCVEFESKDDKDYQTANMQLQEITDEDTLDISVNAQFSGSGGGDIYGVGVKGEATSTLNASHHVASKDVTFTVHSSITSGIAFTDNGKTSKSVRLTDAMATLAQEKPLEFEEKCGSGFVTAIGNGADLYLLFHFHDLLTKDRVELAFNSKASASMADVFTASGKSDLKTIIEHLYEGKKLDINFVQQGGTIELLPTTLDEARDQVKKLAAAEFKHPRRIFVSIAPYTSLPNYPPFYLIDTSDVRQKAIRYVQRLNSIIYEAQNVRSNLYRDRASSEESDQYYYYYRHQMRAERPTDVADDATKKRDLTVDVLRQLSRPPCSQSPVNSVIPRTIRAADLRGFERSRLALLHQLQANYDACAALVDALLQATNNFDDFALWVGLPIPLNVIASDTISKLDNLSTPSGARADLYAQNVFRHWVERQNQIRCRLFSECLQETEMMNLFTQIRTSLTGIAVPPPLHQTVRFCIAEEDWQCGSIRPNPGCGYNSRDQEYGKNVCASRNQYSAGVRRIATASGGQCGVAIDDVDCYGYSVQPAYPNGP
ncbi:hypothetical protein ACVIQT_002090 [Bradyrhizobium diazoefficiens]